MGIIRPNPTRVPIQDYIGEITTTKHHQELMSSAHKILFVTWIILVLLFAIVIVSAIVTNLQNPGASPSKETTLPNKLETTSIVEKQKIPKLNKTVIGDSNLIITNENINQIEFDSINFGVEFQ